MRALVAVLLVLVIAQGMAGVVLVRSAQQFEIPPPAVTAQSLIVIDSTLGQTLYEKNADEHRSPASLTKIATALVIMDLATDMNELVTIDPADVLTPEDGESMVGLVAGDVLTVRNMLYGLLLNSGNDAADALARHFGQKLLDQEGSSGGDPIARFVTEMNRFSLEVGLQNTNFVNPEGLYAEDHYTTARDLAQLAILLLADPILAETVSTQEITVSSSAAVPIDYTLVNTNRLLGEDGVLGIKTGTLSESGACLASAKTSPGGTTVVSIVLDSDILFDDQEFAIQESDMRYQDAETLYSSMTTDFAWIQPATGAALPGLPEEMAVWEVGMNDDLPVLLTASQAADLQYRLRLGPVIGPGEVVGSLMLYSGSELVGVKDVVQLPLAA